MEVVFRLQQLFFQQEVDLEEAGVLFLERVDGLIHGRQAQGGGDARAVGPGHAEIQPRLRAGRVDRLVGVDGDGQVARRIYHDQASVALDLAPLGQGVGVQFQCAVELRRQVNIGLSVAVLGLQRARGDGLPGADDIQVERAGPDIAEDVHVRCLADAVNGALRPQQHGAVALGLEIYDALGRVALRVARGEGDLLPGGGGNELELAQAVGIGGHGVLAPFGLDGEGGGDGRPVGGGGDDVDDVLHAGHELAAFGHGLNQDALAGDGDGDVGPLGVRGAVGDGGLQDEGGCALFQPAADEVVGQRELKGVVALGVGLALNLEDLVELDVKGVAGQDDLAPFHRFAKEVSGLQRAGHLFAGQVEGLVGRGAHLELGQHVGFDDDGRLRGGVADHGLQLVIAGVDLISELEIGGGDAVRGGGERAPEDLVAFGVGDGQLHRLLRGRLEIGRAERQDADVDHLARLVDGLVGGEQGLVVAHDGDRLLGPVAPAAGVGLHNQDTLGGGLGRHGEGNVGAAGDIGRPLIEGHRFAAGGRSQRHFDFSAGNGLAAAYLPDNHAQSGRQAGRQALLPVKERLLVRGLVWQTHGVEAEATQADHYCRHQDKEN